MSEKTSRETLADHIDTIEGAYEFFLAYAAQGITRHEGSKSLVSQAERHLDAVAEALASLPSTLDRAMNEDDAPPGLADFGGLVKADASSAAAIVAVVRAQDAISSQLVDNLNASVHIRTLLTDLFILDEVLKLGVDAATSPEASGAAS